MFPYANAFFPHTEDAIDYSMHHYILLPLRKKNKITANRNMICDQFTDKLCFGVKIWKKLTAQSQYNRVDCFWQLVSRLNHLGNQYRVKSEDLGEI